LLELVSRDWDLNPDPVPDWDPRTDNAAVVVEGGRTKPPPISSNSERFIPEPSMNCPRE
jgi:hypothetical protein